MTQLMFPRRHCRNKLKPKTSLHLKSLRHSAVKRDIIARSLSLNVKSETTPCISETGSMYSTQTAFIFESFSSLTTAQLRGIQVDQKPINSSVAPIGDPMCTSAEFAVNNAPSAITLASPFLANSGQNPRLRFKPSEPLDTDLTAQQHIKLLDIKNFTKKMEDLTEHLRVEMLIAQAVYEFSANRSCRPCPHYFIGDKV